MPDSAPAPRKTVKTIAVTITPSTGSAFTAGLVSATPFPPLTAETDTVAAFSDPVATTVPRPLATLGEMTVSFIDEGQAFGALVSTVATFAVAVTFHDGTNSTTRTVSRACSVKSMAPGGDIDVDGDRKATVVLTIQPVGGGTLADAGVSAGS